MKHNIDEDETGVQNTSAEWNGKDCEGNESARMSIDGQHRRTGI